jgi:hypothetical protein
MSADAPPLAGSPFGAAPDDDDLQRPGKLPRMVEQRM